MPQWRMEWFRLLLEHLAWIEHQFLSGIRDSKKAESPWGMIRGVGGVRISIHQSWLAKGLGLGLLCWGFKRVQQVVPSEEGSTLQIRSVAFPPGQYASPHIHPCHRLFDHDGHQDSSSALWDKWWDERGCDEGHWHAHTRGLSWGLPEVVRMVRQVHCSRRRLLRRRLGFCVYYQ